MSVDVGRLSFFAATAIACCLTQLREGIWGGANVGAAQAVAANKSLDAPSPEAIASGKEPFLVVGAVAGG